MVMLSPAAVVGFIAANPLQAAGITADGIAKGSIAAGVQSRIGSVVASGLFSTLQSAGAAGYGAAAAEIGAAAVSVAISVTESTVESATAAAAEYGPAADGFGAFVADIGAAAVSGAMSAAESTAEYIAENPLQAAAIGAAVVCAGVALAPGIVASPALSVAGFTADGVAKGSLAAGVHSGLGNVVAHGAFATFQSAAAAGYGAPIVAGAVSGVAGVAGAAAAGAAYHLRNSKA